MYVPALKPTDVCVFDVHMKTRHIKPGTLGMFHSGTPKLNLNTSVLLATANKEIIDTK